MSKKPRRGFPSGWFPDHSDAIARMSTKNVMSPLLWGSGVMVSLLLVAAIFIDGTARNVLIALVAVNVIFVLAAYTYFALKDPDRLQSEDLAMARQHFQLLRETGKSPATLDLMANKSFNPEVQEVASKEETP